MLYLLSFCQQDFSVLFTVVSARNCLRVAYFDSLFTLFHRPHKGSNKLFHNRLRA